MASFILRYYYSLIDDTAKTESLLNIFKQDYLSEINISSSLDLSESDGFFFNLSDSSGKMNILGVKTSADIVGWEDGWKLLQDWEARAALCSADLMGSLTVLVTTTGNWSELLQAIAPLLPLRDANYQYASDHHLFGLPIDKKNNEAIYVYAPASPQTLAFPLLIRKLPILHGQMIYLYELDSVLLDRNISIGQEKEELGKDLIRILHTKLVMNQPSLNINEELERDIERLASAFAKLVEDKNLIADGRKRLQSMLKGLERQFFNEPDLNLEPEEISKMMAPYHTRLEELKQTHEELTMVEDNYQAAIEVVQSKIQVINSRTNISTQEQIRELLNINTAMQKKSLIFQYAAGLIEFIVLAYYGLTLWEDLTYTAAEIIPSWIQFIFLLMFSGNTVLVTHYLAEYMQGEVHVRKKLIYASATLVIIFIIILVGTIMTLGHIQQP